MDPRLIQVFGPRFLVDDVRDLELLTDLLAHSQDHLNVVFAVASYLEQVPDGTRNFRPVLQSRLQHSIAQLSRPATPQRVARLPQPSTDVCTDTAARFRRETSMAATPAILP